MWYYTFEGEIMKIKNVILDMGNVLLNYDPDFSLDTLCTNPEAKPIIKKYLFEGYEWIQTDLGVITPEHRFESVKKHIPEQFHNDFASVHENWAICMTPVDGAKEFCDYLKRNGYRIFILSNASTEFYTYFTKQFELDFFDGYAVSCDLKIIKPDERIYKHILDKYSLVPEECLFIDDRKENTDAAEKLGMFGFEFKKNYDEITALIERQNGI